jgi:hypothetical protein
MGHVCRLVLSLLLADLPKGNGGASPTLPFFVKIATVNLATVRGMLWPVGLAMTPQQTMATAFFMCGKHGLHLTQE